METSKLGALDVARSWKHGSDPRFPCMFRQPILCTVQLYRSHTPLRPAFLGELEKQSGSSWEAVAVFGPGRPILEFQSRLAFEIC